MTKMDSYEASHGDIRRCGKQKGQIRGKQVGKRGTSDKATNREIQSPTRLDQWIRTRLDARPV